MLLRLQKRNKPEFESLQNYFDIRTCCTLVEQVGKEFYCDCQLGMKGKICQEAMALTYFPVHKNIDTVQETCGQAQKCRRCPKEDSFLSSARASLQADSSRGDKSARGRL